MTLRRRTHIGPNTIIAMHTARFPSGRLMHVLVPRALTVEEGIEAAFELRALADTIESLVEPEVEDGDGT